MTSPFQAENSGQAELHPVKLVPRSRRFAHPCALATFVHPCTSDSMFWYLDLDLNQKFTIIGRVFLPFKLSRPWRTGRDSNPHRLT